MKMKKNVFKKAKKCIKKDESFDLTEKEVEGFISKLGLKKIGEDFKTVADDSFKTNNKKKCDKIKHKIEKDEVKQIKKKNTHDEFQSKKKDNQAKKFEKSYKLNKIISKTKKHLKTKNTEKPTLIKKKIKIDISSDRVLMETGLWTQNEFQDDPISFESVTKDTALELKTLAEQLWKEDIVKYSQRNEKKKDGMKEWMKEIQSRGTSGDKMASWVLLVQESNLHHLHQLDPLISLVLKHRSKSFEALETLRDLFLQVLLPVRKLKTFEQRPLGMLDTLSKGNKELKAKRLILWIFEDALKQKYADFLKALEILLKDNVEAVRKKATGIVLNLLCENPEEEKRLLEMLVNKMGDPSAKVSSSVIHLLNKLLLRHPDMKRVVSLEVERLLFRPNVALKAQFYGICFLGSLKINEADSALACKLLDIYFTFFKMYIKKGDLETKMLSALLTGINKTYTFAKVNKDEIGEHASSLYKLIHMARFNTALLALMLLYQIMDVDEKASERFYVALYDQLLNTQLPSSSKLPLFLNLLCKAMRRDTSISRTQAFTKRLLQVCQSFNVPMTCSSLLLLSQVAADKPNAIKLNKHHEDNEEEDEEEHFVDHDDDDENEKNEDGEEEEEEGQKEKPSSWVHRRAHEYKLDHYDSRHRNPLYCRADLDCCTELILFTKHHHPSVAIFAQALLNGNKIDYSGNPLKDFTFKHFLSKFITKNPKTALSEDTKEESRTKKKSEDLEVDDDEEIVEGVNDNEEVDFGDDLKYAFKQFDEDILDDIVKDDTAVGDEEADNDDDFMELDEDELDNEEEEEKEEDDVENLFEYSEKDMKQRKWEEKNEFKTKKNSKNAFKRKNSFNGGKKPKKFKKR